MLISCENMITNIFGQIQLLSRIKPRPSNSNWITTANVCCLSPLHHQGSYCMMLWTHLLNKCNAIYLQQNCLWGHSAAPERLRSSHVDTHTAERVWKCFRNPAVCSFASECLQRVKRRAALTEARGGSGAGINWKIAKENNKRLLDCRGLRLLVGGKWGRGMEIARLMKRETLSICLHFSG